VTVKPLTRESALAVYTLLRLIGAPAGTQEHFVHTFTTEPPSEWRFQGSLGFGGKLWLERERWRVSCYSEDDTPERVEKIELVNALLEQLRQRFDTDPTFERTFDKMQIQDIPNAILAFHETKVKCRYCRKDGARTLARCPNCGNRLWRPQMTFTRSRGT
jgi:hypothetical protein